MVACGRLRGDVLSQRCAEGLVLVRWASAEEIDDLDLAWEHDRNLVRVALEDGG